MARLAPLTLLLAPILLAACEIDIDRDPDDTAVEVPDVDADGDGWMSEFDCDDDDPEVSPDAAEWCNGIDDDCDGETDEADAVDPATWYGDNDSDGYGDADATATACDPPSGYVATGDDCDDQDASTYPGAVEVCGDGVANDCDGLESPCLISGDVAPHDAQATPYGEADGDHAGYAVAGVGDVNADGFGDILVGAPYADADETDAGVAYLVLGPVSGELNLALADARLSGKDPEGGVGMAVAGAGDVDADGYDDLLIGAPHADTAGDEAGAAYLVLGPVSGDTDPDSATARLVGTSSFDWTGWSVVGAGDVDADGFADLLVGAPFSDKGGSNAGAAFLLWGPVSGDLSLNDADAQLYGEENNDGAGLSVGRAGDVDGDGLDDLVIGAPGSAEGGSNAGAAYLVLGAGISDLDLGSADTRYIGEAAYDGAGGAVAGAGDVDGDGLDDVLVGASTQDAGGSDAGAAYLMLGTARGQVSLASAHAKLVGQAGLDLAGASAAGVGDADDDGHADVLVGAPGHDTGGTDAGAAYLVLGPIEGEFVLDAADVTFVASQATGRAGAAVAGAGDPDGDGLHELLIGAPDSSEYGADRGAAYLLTIVDW